MSLYRSGVTHYGDFEMFDRHDWTLWWEFGVVSWYIGFFRGFLL